MQRQRLTDLELLDLAVEEEVVAERAAVARLVVAVPHKVLVEVHHLLVELAGGCLAQLQQEVHLVLARWLRSTVGL